MGEFSGQAAVVTGAARGIGAATARLLAREGAAVALIDLPGTSGPAVASEIAAAGGSAQFIACDLKDETQVRSALATVKNTFGRLDALVNVAAINRKGRVEDFSVADWDLMMAVNVRSMFLTTKYAVPLLRASGGGGIVNLSSVSAFLGSDGYAAYHTTKGAVLSLTRSLALELAPEHIRVNAICPGWVETPFTDEALALSDNPEGLRADAARMHILGRMAKPEEVADAVFFFLSRRASFITGETLFVDGGFMVKK